MSINKTYGVYGLMGAGLAGLIIWGTMRVYPMSGTSTAGHVLVWAMAGIVGLKVMLFGVEREEARMETAFEGHTEESGEAAAAEVRRERRIPVEGITQPARIPVTVHSRMAPAAADMNGCLEFASENPICSLATLDETGKRPRVRTIFLWRADAAGFYFVLFSNKAVSRQIKAHPEVELCFRNSPEELDQARQMRVSGKLELLQNDPMRTVAAADRDLWSNLSGDSSRNEFELYRLSDYKVEFWAMNQKANAERIPNRQLPQVDRGRAGHQLIPQM